LRLARFHILLIFIFFFNGYSQSQADSRSGNVHPCIKISFSERFRLVSWDNAIHLDNAEEGAATFTRHRTSFMGQWYATDQMEIGLKFTNEFRYHFVPQPPIKRRSVSSSPMSFAIILSPRIGSSVLTKCS